MRGYISAREAAEKLGYEYTHFTRLLKADKVEGAVYWHGYAIPEDISREEVSTRKAGRPKS
jgi:hypothetical protein